MNLRPKTRRRLMVLLGGAALCIAALTALIEIQLYRHEAVRRGFRDKAMLAYGRGDYVGAMIGLKKYLSQSTVDAPAIYAYAVARSQVPEPDLKHLVEAKVIFNRYLEINPSDSPAQHRLLEIYRQIRYEAEASALAETLLARDPTDVEALQAKLQVLIDHQEYDPALVLSMRVNDLAPLDLDAQITTYRLMAQLKRPADEIVDRAQKMLVDHPLDPRFELLRAVAAGFDGDENGVATWLRIASTRHCPDAQFVHALSALYERIGWFAQSRKLLADWLEAPHADPQMLAELIERQWEAGESPLDRLSEFQAADRNADARLLGLKALTLYTRGADDNRRIADAIRRGLSLRNGENIASAWNSLLQARFSLPPVAPNKAVALCQAALHRDPENAIGRYFLGLSYDQLGETELALECWRLAGNLAPSWAAPHLSKSQILLDAGRIDQAYEEAQAARASSEKSLDSDIMLAQVMYAELGDAPSSNDLDSLLGFVQTIRSRQPNDAGTLSITVQLLARMGQRQEALQAAQRALQAQAKKSFLPPSVLLSLAQVSAKERLGLEPVIADLLEQIKPATLETTYDRALILAMLDERADGLRSLTSALGAAGKDAVEWQLASLQYRQANGESDLKAEWASLGDANQKNLIVQRAVLQASVESPNRGLVDRTIDRLKALTGEECISWRLARARWELDATSNIKTNAGAAAAMMGDVVRMAPDLPEPHVLWATALEKLQDPAGAIDRLRAAAALDPGDFDIALRLADQLQLQGQDDQSSGILESLAKNQFNFPQRQLQIARVLHDRGQVDAAIRVLNSPGARFSLTDRDLLLAQIYQSQDQIEPAGKLYDELAKSASPSDAIIQAIAWFQAWRGDVVGGRRILEKLTDAHELALADFDEAFASPDAAMAHHQAAVTASPADVTTWRALAGFQLRLGKFSDAAATADSALKSAPGDPDLTAIKAYASTLQAFPSTAELKLLITALSTHPTDEASAQTLDALVHDPADAPDKSPLRLREIADNYPRYLPAQMLLVEQYFSAGQVDEAQSIAQRAMQALPADPEPARVLATLSASVGRWNNALDVARAWRKRTLGRPQDADIKIAEANLHLNDPSAAMAQLAPYLAQAQTSPNQSIDVIRLYTEALVRSGRANDARAMLDPLLQQSPHWRELWLDLGVRTSNDVATARQWIEKVAPLASKGTDDERVALAAAWCDVGQRFNDSALLMQSRSILQPLSEREPPIAAAWLMLGEIAQQMNDLPTAETDFRKSLQIDTTGAAAKDALANLILLRGGDLDEAKRLADDAIAQVQTSSAFRCTLASIDARSANFETAAAGFNEAIALNAQNANAFIGLADIQLRTAHRPEAAIALEQAESMLDGRLPATTLQRQRLEDLRTALRKNAQTTSVSDLK
jgi:tetratricopeptide (TPR) repeat protein